MFSPMKVLLCGAAVMVLSVAGAQAAEPAKTPLTVPPSAHEMPQAPELDEAAQTENVELAEKMGEVKAEVKAEASAVSAAPVHKEAAPVVKPEPISARVEAAPRMAEWGYDGANAPQLWTTLDPAFATCGNGKAQSPVNIAAYQPEQMERLKIAYAPTTLNVINSGKGIGVKYEPGSKFMAENKVYDLQAFKFQAPSEHYVNGAPYPLEMQLLHTGEDGKIAALSLFFKLGEPNAVIQSIWDNIPARAGEEVISEDVTLDLTGLMPSDGTYYAYDGSLSIPPCTEGVKWYVLKTPVEISLEQLHAIQALYPSNARPVQPLNGRVVKGTQ